MFRPFTRLGCTAVGHMQMVSASQGTVLAVTEHPRDAYYQLSGSWRQALTEEGKQQQSDDGDGLHCSLTLTLVAELSVGGRQWQARSWACRVPSVCWNGRPLVPLLARDGITVVCPSQHPALL